MAPAVDDSPQLLACGCLNVRLRIIPTGSVPPEPPNDAAFSKIYVGEDGIQVAHPQLTLRVKSPGVTIPGTTKCSRFTTLTCLVCDLAVYRVHQVISVEVEAKDLPLLPTDDWTEQEIMKSQSGWIEVHKDCLDVDAITQIENSKDYSSLFSLTLPPAPDTNPTSPIAWISPDSTASPAPPPAAPPASYLNDLPPLFPPPPFTPSHSAFLHLVSLAEKESESLRAIANEELTRVVKAKASEVQVKEAELKVQVERLWLKFKRGLDRIQQVDRSHTSSLPVPWSSTARTSDHRTTGQKAPVTVRSFDPVSVTAPVAPTPPPPRLSALSASLANPNLHQAMADRNSRNSGSNSTERTVSTRSTSPTLVPTLVNGRETSSVLRFPRLVDDTINTAASYRYFLNIEEEMARHKKGRGQEADSDHDETVRMAEPLKPPVDSSNKESEAITTGAVATAETTDQESAKQTKGKNKSRHVHFNVQPATKGTQESLKKSNGVNKPDPGEMVFPLDDDIEGGEGQPLEGQILPLLEQPIIPPRARRKVPPAGSSAPFPGLRPESLPAPSQMRSARPTNIDTYSNNIMLSLRHSSGPISKTTNTDKEDTTDQETSEDTTDSSPRPTSESDSDLEDEPGADHHLRGWGIPQSLPINVVSSIRPREVLSLKSYQPKSNIAEHQQVASTAPTTSTGAHRDKMSASAIRRAAHAERDRSRSLDPGNLDFVAEEDEGDEEEQDRPIAQSMESGERGRRHALKILQAGADIPEEGMWRSLAP